MAKGNRPGGSGGGGGAATALNGTSGYNVTVNGQNMQYFFEKQDGVTYYKNSIGAIGEPTPENMTERQMIDRMKNNGVTVNKMSKSELTQLYDSYKSDRAQMNEFLNQAYVQDKTMKKGSKANRIGSRVRRRK